jgi:hypothetical protein
MGGASFAAAAPFAAFQSGSGGSDQPGVHRKAFALGCLFDAGLQVLGHPEVDPGHRVLVATGGRDAMSTHFDATTCHEDLTARTLDVTVYRPT